MKIEELKGMSHEDLVRRIQELEEENETLKSRCERWCESWGELNDRFNCFRNAVKSVVLLVDEN